MINEIRKKIPVEVQNYPYTQNISIISRKKVRAVAIACFSPDPSISNIPKHPLLILNLQGVLQLLFKPTDKGRQLSAEGENRTFKASLANSILGLRVGTIEIVS